MYPCTGDVPAAMGEVTAGHSLGRSEAGQGELATAFQAVRARLDLFAAVLGLAAVAWWSTIDRMTGMDAGPGTDLGALGWFLGLVVPGAGPASMATMPR